MAKPIDMIGKTVGQLTIIERAENIGTNAAWLCSCSCGGTKVVRGGDLRSGEVTSCGCFRRERAARLGAASRGAAHGSFKHGHSSRINGEHPLYAMWHGMRQRCSNPNSSGWPYYGGRGISVCEEWRNDFLAFLRDVGERPEGTSLDRIDADGNYEPGNVRWADRKTQRANHRTVLEMEQKLNAALARIAELERRES